MTMQESGSLWFVPIANTDGFPRAQIPFTGATWTQASLTLTKVGAFTTYAFHAGDRVSITSGTGATAALYTVASRTSDDAIVLTTSIGAGADGLTNMAGALFPTDHSSTATLADSVFATSKRVLLDGFTLLDGDATNPLTVTVKDAAGTTLFSTVYDGATNSVASFRAYLFGPNGLAVGAGFSLNTGSATASFLCWYRTP